jgi:hypothetical protein
MASISPAASKPSFAGRRFHGRTARTQRDFGSIDANAANTHAYFALTWFLDFNLFDSEHLGSSEFMDANTADHVLSFLSKL